MSQKQVALVDSLNQQAYDIRYSDIDSTASLARHAFELAGTYDDGKARALNMLGYVAYQQMDFGRAFARLDSVKLYTNNQIILLVSDVLRMKINQRTGNGTAYFEARVSAQKRIRRAEEEYQLLSEADRHDYFYAKTEYHIISSTYCYYQDQEQQAIEEIEAISDDFTIVTDSTQWLYYHYMLGSGGLIEGTPEEVATREFDHLMICYTFSRQMGITYFEANSLQALASLLSDERNRQIIEEKNRDLYYMLVGHHIEWLPMFEADAISHLPEALAQHAVYAFRSYKDLFQTACAYRTLGEMSFKHGHYEQALENYSMALDCVNEQFIYNHGSQRPGEQPRLLSLYQYDETEPSDIELQWIDSDTIYTVPEWIAGIRQKISMAYSALGMKAESDFNRGIYLDIIARTSQNVEMESRKAQLEEEAEALRFRLRLTALLFVLLLVLIIYYARHLRKQNELRLRTIRQASADADELEIQADKDHLETLEEQLEELDEQVQLYTLKIDNNKRRNAEKRSKVSLVHAVTPFLDRIINQNDRMQREGRADEEKLQYIIELTDRIVTYNDILTDWIKMEKGELAMQIGTIELDRLFQTIQRGHYAYDQKGVTLNVRPTDLRVKADEALTLFMLNTLADNARKFTPEGGSVTVSADGFEDYVELSITDTGCGMSEEDVDTLNNSKVYDSRKIGSTKEGKGFGFGIMNCRGIIEKYRKTSSYFNVCRFGVESRLGEGSRFFFRLPRVLSICLLFLLSMTGMAAKSTEAQRLYDVAYQQNKASEFEQALNNAFKGVHCIEPSLRLSREEELGDPKSTNEVDLFLRGDSLNYQLLINLRNEIACAALALNEWEIYRYNNALCTSLYKLYHQDRMLPTYCEKLQQTQSTSRQLLVLLVLFSILVIILCLGLLHRRMYYSSGMKMQQELCERLKKIDIGITPAELSDIQDIASHLLRACFEGMNNWQHVEGISLQLLRQDGSQLLQLQEGRCEGETLRVELQDGVGQMLLYGLSNKAQDNLNEIVYKTLAKILHSRVILPAETIEQCEHRQDEVNHLRYEERRLHVQNQILDNCLSTIKHESMYYPSRIQQLASRIVSQGDNASTDDLQQLHELSYYYKEVYTLLSNQADKLTSQTYYRKEKLNLRPILVRAQKHFNKLALKQHIPLTLTLTEMPDITVSADAVLMEELMTRFNIYFLKRYAELTSLEGITQPELFASRDEGGSVRVTYRLHGITMDETQAHTLFYPESGHVNLLIAKQIVRELDALNNFPGLRLVAESHEAYTDIWLTLCATHRA